MLTKNNILIGAAVAIILVGAGLYIAGRQMSPQGSTVAVASQGPQTRGTVVFGVSDAAGDMGGVTSVTVTVTKVEMHSTSTGWSVVSVDTKQYDLLALKRSGAISILASTTVAAGVYNQVRLTVSKVVVVKNGLSTEAKLPSGELKINETIVVGANHTASVVFDFLTDKSLHLTGNGTFIFAPVVTIKRHTNTHVEAKGNDEMTVMGGTQEQDEHVGMDEKGEVRHDFELHGALNVDAQNHIKLETN